MDPDPLTTPEELRFKPGAPLPEYKRIIYEPGRVTRIILNRPRYQSAISHPMYAEIQHAVQRAGDDPECRVLVVSGAGRSFSSGHDTIGGSVEGAPVLADGVPAEELRKRFNNEKEMWRAYWTEHNWFAWQMHPDVLYAFPKPSISMVHGYCIFGGAFVATDMDLVFATEDALFLGAGGRWWWDMNPRKMLEVSYEHRFVTGREAHEMGWVNRVYPDYETLEREALAFANRIAENPLSGLMHTKQGFHEMMAFRGFPRIPMENLYRSAWEMQRGIATAGRASVEAPDPGERHQQRYEGKGMARSPRAMANLKIKLESEGKPVPQTVLDAVARFEATDLTAFWSKALHQGWRDPENIAKAEEEAKAYAEAHEKEKSGKG